MSIAHECLSLYVILYISYKGKCVMCITQEAGKRLEQNLRTEGNEFEGKVSERVLGFIVYSEEIRSIIPWD